MGSMYAKIRREQTLGTSVEKEMRITDFDDTDPYYFVIKEGGQIIAEGDLMTVKIKLPEGYIFKKIKEFHRTRSNMVAEINF